MWAAGHGWFRRTQNHPVRRQTPVYSSGNSLLRNSSIYRSLTSIIQFMQPLIDNIVRSTQFLSFPPDTSSRIRWCIHSLRGNGGLCSDTRTPCPSGAGLSLQRTRSAHGEVATDSAVLSAHNADNSGKAGEAAHLSGGTSPVRQE